jgi:hypothetical protein
VYPATVGGVLQLYEGTEENHEIPTGYPVNGEELKNRTS